MISNNTEAIVSELTPLHLRDNIRKRLMIVLKTRGCSYARKTGGCKHCSLFKNADLEISYRDIIKQFDNELRKYNIKDYDHIDILSLGSFLDKEDIPTKALEYILKKVSQQKNLKSVMIESRPEFITEELLEKCSELLNGKELHIGIGIESSSIRVSSSLLEKGFNIVDVEKAMIKMKKYNIGLSAYVLLKPVGLSEKEAIDDAINTIKEIFSLGKKIKLYTRIALEPFFIVKDSNSFDEYKKNNYKTPMLWSVIEVVKAVHELGDIFIALNDENLSEGMVAKNCDECTNDVKLSIVNFNKTNDIMEFAGLNCCCKNIWKNMINEKNINRE